MIDACNEQLLTLAAAAREVPNRNSCRGVNASTVWRWAQRGVRGVRLETLCIGGIRFTSREAIQAFFEATTAAANAEPIPRTSAKRLQLIEDAERELKQVGVRPLTAPRKFPDV